MDALAENVSVHKAVAVLVKTGLNHKSVIARTCVAKLLAEVTNRLGADRILDDEEDDTTENILEAGVTLLNDGSQTTRIEAKRLFKPLVGHKDFEDKLERLVKNQTQVKHARKSLDAIKAGK